MGDGNAQRFTDHNERASELDSTENTPSAQVKSTSSPGRSGSLPNLSTEVYSGSQPERDAVPRRERGINQQPESLGRSCVPPCCGASVETLVDSFGRLSLQCACPLQQVLEYHYSGDSGHSGVVQTTPRKSSLNNERYPGGQPCHHECGLFDVCLFKRRIIERDDLEFALYIIPTDKFCQVFPKIKKNEALVYHGTEFPVVEATRFTSLHQQLYITDSVSVSFELLGGHNFSIVSAPMTTATVSHICSKSKERILCGFSVSVLTRCHGGKDHLFEDIITVKLQSGDRTLQLFFPVAFYEARVSPWLYDSVSVTSMPQEDKDALRSCHVDLLDNIGDVVLLCQHLYQHKILDSGDLEEIMSHHKKRDRNFSFLDILPRRGNILDFVIKVMQAQRQNQGAAVILQRRRHCGANPQ